ncbi:MULTISPECIES: cation diffusion facilitator family transporter [unclassified Synechococcus]|uniref:cation diffusion facilitator family transporter n=1 Tax=unclassified Synechococcus TaxID=2626047 RepID=UPI0021A708EF|nr:MULTISPECIES: cation diffusion facilitator family transporter [unclassified Synechococcus]MCT0213668.1 cation diffusion facilitator family transporter [Synechococcus sp. CS-1326]MCT0234115.1 cation diffusion facilitator family transporter [Synechococcus sp. CS-1327]
MAHDHGSPEAPHPAVQIQRRPHRQQHQHRPGSAAAFRWSVLLNSALSALQLVIGFSFGSLALIGDAVHNLGDVAGLLLGWGAERLSKRPASPRFTYGLGRSTQLASLINAVLILMAAAVVVVEGLQRLFDPVDVVSGPVAWAAAAGIVVNLLSARLFGNDHSHDLNRRAAVVHLLTDAAVSAAVMVSAVLVGLTGWSVLDAATAIAVGLAVAWSGWSLLRESLGVALDGVPPGIELAAVRLALLEIPAVRGVHHLHVWAMSTSQNALTAHLHRELGVIDDMELLHQAKQRMAALGIPHCTLQLEPFEAADQAEQGEPIGA